MATHLDGAGRPSGPAQLTHLSNRSPSPAAWCNGLALLAAASLAGQAAAQLPAGYWDVDRSQPLLDRTLEITLAPDLATLEDAERTLILTALRKFDNNRRQTAEALGISERTLYRKLKDIEAEEAREESDA